MTLPRPAHGTPPSPPKEKPWRGQLAPCAQVLLTMVLLVGWSGALSAHGATPDAGPDPFKASVDLVAGGEEPEAGDLHAVWTQIMQAAAIEGMRSYTAPAALVAYASGEVPDTLCQVGTSVRFWRENARYCGTDATILYDESWLRELADRFGAFAPAAVLAHEWGHHIQVFADPLPPGIRAELQADCFAGMYLGETQGIEPDGSFSMRVDEFEASLRSFFSLGDADYRESQWFQPDVHGSSEQRILAFTTGYMANSLDRGVLRSQVNGMDWCLGYSEFEPGSYVDIGPFRLLGLPGRPGEWLDGALVIEADPSPAFPSSDIRLQWVPTAEPVEQATEEWLAELLEAWLPGSNVTTLGMLAVRTGTGIASTFETRDVTGVGALFVPATGEGGLLITALRPRPVPQPAYMPADLPTFLEQSISVNQVVNRLCAPGESADPFGADHNTICMSDRQ